MKEFALYTALRLALFAGAFAIVSGVWIAVADSVDVMWALVLAFIISGVGSFFLLDSQRQAFAHKVEARADRASAKFEQRRAREDSD